jgi:uncharacterized protein (TIGR03437 family)
MGSCAYNDCMGTLFRLSYLAAMVSLSLVAQTPTNKSLSGKYFYHEVLLVTDAAQPVISGDGSLTFDANGGFAGGTYSVDSSGSVTMTDPLRSGATINARLGTGALIGSNTEAGNNVFSIFVAVPAPASAMSASVLNGTYWIASLEFLNSSFASKRQTFFPVTANGSGSFTGTVNVQGEATNLGDTLQTQTVPGSTYTVNADGSGTVIFPGDPTQQVIAGTKNIYVAPDGSFFFGGGSAAGLPGLVIGIRAGTSLNPPRYFWTADLRVEAQNYSSFAGSSFAADNGRMTWTRRLRTNNGLMDVSDVTPYSVGANGSGTLLDNGLAVSSNGQLFLGSGVASSGTQRYELFFGVQMPAVSGTGSGMFLNPQAVFNVFSFAPAGNPVAQGEFINIYGSGLPVKNASVPPFPTNLGGVQLLINNTAAPISQITATNIYAVVPYSITGSTATIVLVNGGTQSNTVTVPVAATAPGVAALASNGLGAGAITHANGTVVSTSSPASRGETVVIYLTGLGAVSPPVTDGAAPTKLTSSNSVQAVYFGATAVVASSLLFQGLSPQYPGLYQINVTIPLGVEPSAAVPLAIQTTNGFTDMVDIAIQ